MQNHREHHRIVNQCWLFLCQSRCVNTPAAYLQYCPRLGRSVQNIGCSLYFTHLQVEHDTLPHNLRVIHKHELLQGTCGWSTSHSTSIHYHAQHCTYVAVSKTGRHATERRSLPDCALEINRESTNSAERQDTPFILASIQNEPNLVHHCHRARLL